MSKKKRRNQKSNQKNNQKQNQKPTKTESTKPLFLRIAVIVIMAVMVLGFFILPLLM